MEVPLLLFGWNTAFRCIAEHAGEIQLKECVIP